MPDPRETYLRQVSTIELERRVNYLTQLNRSRTAQTSATRASWLRDYKRELAVRKEMYNLAERVKTRSVQDLETQLRVCRDGALRKDRYKDWYERRIEVFEAELESRSNKQLGLPLSALSDEELAFWARYYARKIAATDDTNFLSRWVSRHKGVEKEQDRRKQAKGRIVRPGTPVYLGEAGEEDRPLMGFVSDSWADRKSLSVEFTLDNTTPELITLITGGIMNWSVEGLPKYPTVRAVLRNRYSLSIEISDVRISAPGTSFNLETLSEELSALDVPHQIEISAGRKTLTAGLTNDGFKRLLAKLL